MTNSENKIAIIGLGYVGLPLAVEFAKQFFVIGFDIFAIFLNSLLLFTTKSFTAGLKSCK